jgi:hypothetical protein
VKPLVKEEGIEEEEEGIGRSLGPGFNQKKKRRRKRKKRDVIYLFIYW